MFEKFFNPTRQRSIFLILAILALLFGLWGTGSVNAAGSLARLFAGSPPAMINYQGMVSVSGTPYNGTGYFKFAIVDAGGTTTYWSNDGSSSGGDEPSTAVALAVDQGLFSVPLGDTSQANMTQALDENAFAESDTFLRVWFGQSAAGSFDQLTPD